MCVVLFQDCFMSRRELKQLFKDTKAYINTRTRGNTRRVSMEPDTDTLLSCIAELEKNLAVAQNKSSIKEDKIERLKLSEENAREKARESERHVDQLNKELEDSKLHHKVETLRALEHLREERWP